MGAFGGGTVQETRRGLEARAPNVPNPVSLTPSTVQSESATIYAAAQRAVVGVATYQDLPGSSDDNGPPSRSGFGFIVHGSGTVLTAGRLVANAKKVTVVLQDGRTLPVTRVTIDPLNDLAVLQVSAGHLRAVPMGSSDELRVGDKVIALGGPVIRGTVGTVHATGAATGGGLAIDARPTGQPHAGLPLLNSRGEAIGILTDASPTGSGTAIEFAVPIDRAKRLMRDPGPAPYRAQENAFPNGTSGR
jgi:S1-C subfamily serine protease